MDTARIFTNGGSQVVRGDIDLLIPQNDRWQRMLASLDLFTDDFLSEEIDPLPPENKETFV